MLRRIRYWLGTRRATHDRPGVQGLLKQLEARIFLDPF